MAYLKMKNDTGNVMDNYVNNGNLLELKDLTVRFKTLSGTVHAVNGVSYAIEKNKIVGIIGESGSGKSVSVKSLIHLLPENAEIISGSAMMDGRDLLKMNKEDIRKIRGNKISMIFQDPMSSLNPVLTIGFQLCESLRNNLNLTKKEAEKRSVELLSMVGIPSPEARMKMYPHQFSGGMRQRVMIAMGISCHPSLLIADEATTALDVTIQAQIIEEVKRIKESEGMSVIWISHDLATVAGIADHVIVMYAGNVMEDAPVDELFDNPMHPYSIGLLESIPSIDDDHDTKLKAIEGMLPNVLVLPEGCPFYDRCTKKLPVCKNQKPVLKTYGENHKCACWLYE